MKRLILTKTYQNLNSFTAYRSEFFENPSFKRPVVDPGKENEPKHNFNKKMCAHSQAASRN